MNKTSIIFLTTGIAIIVILLIPTSFFIFADKAKLADSQFSVDLNFASAMGTLLAIAIAFIGIAYSVKKAQIDIYLPDVAPGGSLRLRQIMVRNIGDAVGNVALAVIEIFEMQSSPIKFAQGEGGLPLEFMPSRDPKHNKVFRYRVEPPLNIYPDKDALIEIGFIEVPKESAKQVKFRVLIIGTQGKTSKTFKIKT